MLAAVLVFAGAMPAHAASIYCFYDEGGCDQLGYFDAALGFQSITWNFHDSQTEGNLVYSFLLAGVPSQSFFVDVRDPWTGPENVPGGLPCVVSDQEECLLFTAIGYAAVPIQGDDGYYYVPGENTTPTWVDGYNVAVVWNAGDVIDAPYYVTILKHNNESDWDFTDAVSLTDIRYAPYLAPPDPGIGGRGNTFSTFGVFQGTDVPARIVSTKEELIDPVPEPASIILLGSGLAGLAMRGRRRRK